MNRKTVIVVGDEYAVFSRHNGVKSVSWMWHELASARDIDFDHVYFGHGLGAQECHRLSEALLARGVQSQDGRRQVVEVELTHKLDQAHVLLACAKKLREHNYAYSFFLDDAQDRLCDHVTGQHVSAMLLIEAARQGVIASLEQQYSGRPDITWGHVLENLVVNFSSYAFPIPTSLFVEIRENSAPTQKQIDVSVFITFRQVEQDICEMRFDVKMVETDSLSKIEDRKARKVVDLLLSNALQEVTA